MTSTLRGRGERLDIVILGLSITSAWGNAHAAIYRALVKALAARGHRVRFFERDVAAYAQNRDLPRPPYADLTLYGSLEELSDEGAEPISRADLVIVGSRVPDGVVVGAWVRQIARGLVAFYDIDTPATLASLDGGAPYLSPTQVPAYDLYLSFIDGPVLRRLERDFGARAARPLLCAFDPDLYRPDPRPPTWDLGYLGTTSADRQPALVELLLGPARALPDRPFVVAGPLHPQGIAWPDNVQRLEHVPPAERRAFYCSQRFTLNLTPAGVIRAGTVSSARLFEAAACGVPIISNVWSGLASLFEPEREILIARDTAEVIRALTTLSREEGTLIGRRARQRVLAEHTSENRALQLESYIAELRDGLQRSHGSAPRA